MTELAHLSRRGVLRLTGADRVGFLQGLVSNDVALAGGGAAVWAALLSPQGKYLADFFVLATAEALLLDVEAGQAAMLAHRLGRFRLRAAVAIEDVSGDLQVYAAWNGGAVLPPACLSAADPRLAEAGTRILAPAALPATASEEEYDRHRLRLGLPDGTRDLEPDKTILLEANFDLLNGISWTKGCYMGQELTARTRYRGLIKRRLMPVEAPVEAGGGLPPPGTPIISGDREVGTLRSGHGGRALATLRLDALAGPLTAAGVGLVVDRPEWLSLAD